MRALPSTKRDVGVQDLDWYEGYGADPVGTEILKEHPTMIIDLDSPPVAHPLGGAYRLAKVQSLGGYLVSYYVRSGDRSGCPSSGSVNGFVKPPAAS